MTLRRAAVLLVAAAALALPAGASADAITRADGNQAIVYEAAAGASQTLIITSTGTAVAIDGFEPITVTGSGCVLNNSTKATCPRLAGGIDAQRVEILAGALDDRIEAKDYAAPMRLVLRGGEGADVISGSALPDSLDGGPDADVLIGRGLLDEIGGGTGFDRVDYAAEGVPGGVTVTLDGQAGDGHAGENDNVHTDVEDVMGTPAADVITGSSAGNVLTGGGGDDRLAGGGGFDFYDGGDGADTILARDGLAERVDCGGGTDGGQTDDIDVPTACEAVSASPDAVNDRDADGVGKPLDCNDGNAAVRPGAPEVPDNGVDDDCAGGDAVDLDRDRDGSPRPVDCDDGNAQVNPRARERRGNRVDEDCSGRADPFARIDASVRNAFRTGATIEVLLLRVVGAPAKAKVRVRCSGGGCPFTTRTRTARKGRAVDFTSAFAGARLRTATLEVRITKRRMIGKLVRYRLRPGRRPDGQVLCLPPGAKKARAC